jgi:hypothetical protein
MIIRHKLIGFDESGSVGFESEEAESDCNWAEG